MRTVQLAVALTAIGFANILAPLHSHKDAQVQLRAQAAPRVPKRSADPVTVKLLIWAKKPGTASGAKMAIAVDGQARGTISNVDEQMLITLGSYAPTIHQFRLTGITGYNVNGDGDVTRASDGSGECSGQFVVQPFQTYYLLMVATQDYKTFQCQIQ